MIRLPIKYKMALKDYKFIDLFCGIGGFHLALRSFGAKCVFASDIDIRAQSIYKKNFEIVPDGDVISIENKRIPAHDILCAGFPCQAFSVSGTQAGFEDKKTGRLFFEIIRIARYHRPKIILLENVANLHAHNEGKTIQTIVNSLEKIGYSIHKKILSAADYNVPQCRKRLYIIAFRNDLGIANFEFPQKVSLKRRLESVLEDLDSQELKDYIIDREYSLREGYQSIQYSPKNPYIRIGEIGKGRQGERIYSVRGCATTLSASSGGLGGRTGIYLINETIRKLTPRECARLMGFPDSFKIAEQKNQAYQQFGNSIVIDVVQRIMIEVIKSFKGGKDG